MTSISDPDPATNVVKKEQQDGRSLAFEWTPPAVGQLTGYFVDHNLQGTFTDVRTDINSLTLVVTKLNLEIVLPSRKVA